MGDSVYKSPMSPMTRTNITLDEATIKLIVAIATTTGASKSEIIRRGVLAYSAELSRQGLRITGTKPARKR